jgi:Ca-activated chloride channel family protein
MDKRVKTGWIALCLLFLGTLGARYAYRAQAHPGLDLNGVERALAVAPERPKAPTPEAWQPRPGAKPGQLKVSAALDRTAVLQGSDGELHVELTVDSRGLGGKRTPTDFVVVLDRSGSMEGQKFEYGKQALRELIQRLEDNDRLALVTYESGTELEFEMAEANASNRDAWLQRVNALRTAGGTNISAGLENASRQIERARREGRAARMLLLSDGLANAGDSSFGGLVGRAQRAPEQGYVLTTVGIGQDFDERLMTGMARAGTGAFYYLEKLGVLPELLGAELKTATETYADSAEIVVHLAPNVRLRSALGQAYGSTRRDLVIPVGSLYGEHHRKLWLTLAAPTNELRDNELGTVSVRYRREGDWYEVHVEPLPKVACVTDRNLFEKRILRDTWERAMLDEEVGRAKEELGAAISSASPAAVDLVLDKQKDDLELARRLGSKTVSEQLDSLNASAPEARAAASGNAPQRSVAAKRLTSEAFGSRNSGSFKNSTYDMGL